jgi:sulfate transport system permease protein
LVDRKPRDIGEPAWARALLLAAALLVVGIMLVMPLLVVFTEALGKGWDFAMDALSEPDALSAIRLTIIVAAIVVPLNTVFGLAAAWCMVHFRFPGRSLLLAMIELPFAVSPVISGMIFVLLFGLQGWLGPLLQAYNVKIVFALPGIVLATLFVTLPFVVRQLMPLMQAQGVDEDEAALTLGASGWQIFLRITLPRIRWALLTGVLLCNARAMGEFGAVSVVSGHIRGLTNTMPLHIEILYNEYNIAAAFAVAGLLACLAIATIVMRVVLEWQGRKAVERGEQAVWVNA